MHYACQKRHVCLGSHLTKPCLSCVVTSKTAAIHVRCQHSMCNFLSCKILQGPHPTALTRKAFLLAYWSIKESYTPFTMHHPMHLPNKCIIHLHAMHLPSLVPRLFIWNKTTMHLPFTTNLALRLGWKKKNGILWPYIVALSQYTDLVVPLLNIEMLSSITKCLNISIC